MKFALTALASVALPAMGLPTDPIANQFEIRAGNLKAQYEAIGPQLADLGLNGLKDIGINLDQVINLGATPLTYYNPVDMAALKANGYAHLASRLEKAGALSLDAGERGLVALRKVIDSGLTNVALLAEANQIAQEASDVGLKALSTLPKPSSLEPGTIGNLRALGLNEVADSLTSVNRGLAGGDKASKFLAALSVLGEDKAGQATVEAYDNLRTDVYTPKAAPIAPAPIATGFYSIPQIGYTGYPYYYG